jgi:hypothetical protein
MADNEKPVIRIIILSWGWLRVVQDQPLLVSFTCIRKINFLAHVIKVKVKGKFVHVLN